MRNDLRLVTLVAVVSAISSAKVLQLPASQCVLGQKVPFVDEADRKPDFAKFRRALLAAVDGKDVRALRETIAPAIKFSFGPEGDGRAGFLAHWKLNGADAAKSGLWTQLAGTLRRGGHWESNEFHFPYVQKSWPATCDEYADYAAVAGNGVAVRATASEELPVVTTLSEELVKIPEGLPMTTAWVKVEAAGEKVGYVEPKALVSPIGYRGTFQLSAKKWTLAGFIAGD